MLHISCEVSSASSQASFPISFSQQYNAVGSLAYHSQRTRKPSSVWTWWIVNLTQGYAVRNREGGRERAYPGLWEVHQNAHCSSSSRCRQSWACLLRLSTESCWRNLFHAGVMLFSVLPDSFSPSSFFPVLLSLRSWLSLLKCKCASGRPLNVYCISTHLLSPPQRFSVHWQQTRLYSSCPQWEEEEGPHPS